MAKLTIALAAEATAFNFGKNTEKARDEEIESLRMRIAKDTTRLNILLEEKDKGNVFDVIRFLKEMHIPVIRDANLNRLAVPGAEHPIAEIDLGVKQHGTRSYAYTVLVQEDGSYALAVIHQKAKLLNYGGHKPNQREREFTLYKKAFIKPANGAGVHAALNEAKEAAKKLADEELHVTERHMK